MVLERAIHRGGRRRGAGLIHMGAGRQQTSGYHYLRSRGGRVMGRLMKDLTGRTFGRLTVLERKGSRQKHALWRCRCACGATVKAVSNHLLSGGKKSCGCLATDIHNPPGRAARNVAIRQARQEGRSYRNIAAEFGLGRETVRLICIRKRRSRGRLP
jgi:hypothetical protein